MRETFTPHDFIVMIQSLLSKRLQGWFVKIFFAVFTTCGTVSCWIRNSNDENRYRRFYHCVQRLGRFDVKLQCAYECWLVVALKGVLHNEKVVRLALDDSPIKRSRGQSPFLLPLLNALFFFRKFFRRRSKLRRNVTRGAISPQGEADAGGRKFLGPPLGRRYDMKRKPIFSQRFHE